MPISSMMTLCCIYTVDHLQQKRKNKLGVHTTLMNFMQKKKLTKETRYEREHSVIMQLTNNLWSQKSRQQLTLVGGAQQDGTSGVLIQEMSRQVHSLCKNSLSCFALFCIYAYVLQFAFKKAVYEKDQERHRWEQQHKLNTVNKLIGHKL